VLEDTFVLGGKARSLGVPDSARPGCSALPGEHGFRFFAGFYRHVPDTMRRIPFGNNKDGVFGNLVNCPRFEFARVGKPPIVVATRPPQTLDDLRVWLNEMLRSDWGVPPLDLAYFVERIFVLLTSCEERRYQQWEYTSWWDVSGAEHRSEAYQTFLADGLTRTFVAAKARLMSARTGGYILLQLLFDMAKVAGNADRILDGPTSERWIGPWRDHLETMGVEFLMCHRATGFTTEGARIRGVTVEHDGIKEELTADFYISAVPLERMAELADDALRTADPRLNGLDHLQTRWMNGVQYYLRDDVDVVRGHVAYMNSKWALTSISQRQFWKGVDFADLGQGNCGGVLSVDVSDWQTPGLNGKCAADCTRDEVIDEVWAQLKAHLDEDGKKVLENANLDCAFVDDDIRWPKPSKAINVEPLLINTTGSWQHRPDAVTAIDNLMLASDYVRTYTDLACMEGANEAARRAVNGILGATGSNEPRCKLWPLHEPLAFAPMRALDRFRFQHGIPHQEALGPGAGPGPVS
jgi:uncharacterized protein with NAD-binding domain and iron-sulfur cluster